MNNLDLEGLGERADSPNDQIDKALKYGIGDSSL